MDPHGHGLEIYGSGGWSLPQATGSSPSERAAENRCGVWVFVLSRWRFSGHRCAFGAILFPAPGQSLRDVPRSSMVRLADARQPPSSPMVMSASGLKKPCAMRIAPWSRSVSELNHPAVLDETCLAELRPGTPCLGRLVWRGGWPRRRRSGAGVWVRAPGTCAGDGQSGGISRSRRSIGVPPSPVSLEKMQMPRSRRPKTTLSSGRIGQRWLRASAPDDARRASRHNRARRCPRRSRRSWNRPSCSTRTQSWARRPKCS